MARHEIKTGFTLTEILVVVVIMSLLIGIALPTAKEIINSFSSSSGVKSVIGAALANARAMAMSRRKYVGLRFQEDSNGNHYMIFIVHEDSSKMGGLANGFRAVAGRKPMRLPVNVGLMDLSNVVDNSSIDEESEVRNAKTFSIVFSLSGKLIQHNVRVRNSRSRDDVFNTKTKVTALTDPVGMFIQDDYPEDGLDQELSRISFIIYDKTEFKRIDSLHRWTDYLQYLAEVYVNPYTGEIVN